MEKYIGSQQHFEDNINDYYDEKERHHKEQIDNREQPDDKEDPYQLFLFNMTDNILKPD